MVPVLRILGLIHLGFKNGFAALVRSGKNGRVKLSGLILKALSFP